MGSIGQLLRASLRLHARAAFAEVADRTPAAATGKARESTDSRVLRCTAVALRRSEERLRITAQVMDEALVIMDRHRALIFASAKFAALAGCTTDDLVGRSFFGLFQRGECNDVRARLAVLPPRSRARCEATLVRADGRLLPVEMTFKRVAAEDDLGPVSWAIVRERPAAVNVPVQAAHDGLGQMLSAVKSGLQSASDAIGNHETKEARATIDGLVSKVKEALEEVRRLSPNP